MMEPEKTETRMSQRKNWKPAVLQTAMAEGNLRTAQPLELMLESDEDKAVATGS